MAAPQVIRKPLCGYSLFVSRVCMGSRAEILAAVRTMVAPATAKFASLQQAHGDGTPIYSPEHRHLIGESFAAVRWKFLVATYHLEELWRLSEVRRYRLLELIDTAKAVDRWDQDDRTLGLISLEAFLLQSRAFLDLFMRHICLILNLPDPGRMSRKKFRSQMEMVKDPTLSVRARRLLEYFQNEVFADGRWGSVLVGVRDKIAHHKQLRPSRQGEEVIFGIRLDWPTIKATSLERFAQDLHNGLFGVLPDTVPLLFERPWPRGHIPTMGA